MSLALLLISFGIKHFKQEASSLEEFPSYAQKNGDQVVPGVNLPLEN